MTRAQLKNLTIDQTVNYKPPGSDQQLQAKVIQNGPNQDDVRNPPPPFLKLQDVKGNIHLWSLDFDINEIT